MELFKADSLKKVILHLGIILILFMGLLLFFFYVYLPNATNHDQTVTVPKVVGMDSKELEDFLKEKNLRLKVNDSTFTPGVKPFTVLTQHPLPETKVKENRMIYVTIAAKNPPEVEMPQLTDLSLKNAQIQLSQHGLVLEGTIPVSGEPDVVYGQLHKGKSIAPKTKIAKGSKITLKVGKSAGEADVPDLVGMTVAEARDAAGSVGLMIVVRPEGSGEDEIIIRQKPSPNEVSTMRRGEPVDVWTK